MAMLIDIHTHNRTIESDVFRIYSSADWKAPLTADTILQPGIGLSVGVHPWEASMWDETDKEALFTVLSSSEVMMIGEIGLDKACDVPFEIQKTIFLFQLDVAARCRKPVVLHGVRAMAELLAIRKSVKNVPAWILHGFRGGSEEAAQYLSAGFYLSFGNYHNQEALRACPVDRFFLETDEKGNIHTLYEDAAKEKGMSLIELESHIERNFRTVMPAVSNKLLL